MKINYNWKNMFSETVLQRGRAYFRGKRVLNYTEDATSVSGEVQGNKKYIVRIVSTTGRQLNGYCTCPAFAEYGKCKHMAAVLYQYEQAHKNDSNRVKRSSEEKTLTQASIVPITRIFDGKIDRNPLYYRLPQILKEEQMHSGDVEEAINLVQNQKVRLDPKLDVRMFTSREAFDEQYRHICQALFSMDDATARAIRTKIHDEVDAYNRMLPTRRGYAKFLNAPREYPDQTVRSHFQLPKDRDIRIEIDQNEVRLMACGVCGYYHFGYQKSNDCVCPHVGAALMELDRYMYRYNPGDETNPKGEHFLQLFTKKPTSTAKDEINKVPEIRLEPRIELDWTEELSLSFRVGVQKMYILKNMPAIVRAYRENRQYELGKNNTLDFARQSFSKESEPFWQLICEEVEQIEESNRRLENHAGYYYDELNIKDSIDLNGKSLDTLFDTAVAYAGGKIEIKSPGSKKNKDYMTFRKESPKLALTIAPEQKGQTFQGVRILGRLNSVVSGKNYDYAINASAHTVTRFTTEHDMGNLESMRALADENGLIQVVLGKKRLANFYYRILPELENDPLISISIKDEDKILQNLAPQAQFTFYLDAEDGYAFCRPLVQYGDAKFVMKPLRDVDFPLPAYRDLSQEDGILQKMRGYFPEYNEKRGSYQTDGTDDATYELLENGVETLMQFGEVQSTEAFHSLHIRRKIPVNVGVGIEGNLLDLQIQTEDLSPDELQDLLASYQRRKKYHRLTNGGFVSLEEDPALELLMQTFETMGLSARDITRGELKLPLYRALYLDKMLEEHEEVAYHKTRDLRKLLREFQAVKDSDYDVPEHLNGTMRNYQVTGHKWMRTLASFEMNGILADDMGLGKTLQVISVLAAWKEQAGSGEQNVSLVVCPSSLIYNWQEEFEHFAPELRVAVVAGTAAVREEFLDCVWDQYDVLVTSYDLLKRDIHLYEGKSFFYAIIDEAQYIKNPKAAAAKSVKLINATHRMALTGTPIENRLSELWSIFDFLMPGFLYTYEKFRSELETPIVKYKDEDATKRLQTMVRPFILRRLKADVLKDLPDKVEEIRYARFEPEQQRIYDAQVVHMQRVLETADEKDKIKILAEITRVRQICCDPALLFEDYTGASAKREAALELIQSAVDGGHRILFFSQFTSMLELLEKDLQENNISYYKITGATPKEERIRLVHAFNENEIPLFLISLKAGGTGLNLTGADVVVHYDPWWNLAAQNQATDRAHRIGQTQKVTVYKLIVKGTIEEKIVELQEAKRDLADAVITGENTPITSMSKDELMELFT